MLNRYRYQMDNLYKLKMIVKKVSTVFRMHLKSYNFPSKPALAAKLSQARSNKRIALRRTLPCRYEMSRDQRDYLDLVGEETSRGASRENRIPPVERPRGP